MLLSDVLPDYDVRERHSIPLTAPPERVFEAVEQTTIGEMPLVRLLFRLRGLPSERERRLLDVEGFARVAVEPGRELVVAAVGRPWSPRGGLRREVDVRSFTDPGYARMALNLLYDGRELSTETRVQCTDPRSRARFRRYWLVIRPFSGLIRRAWLRAIARRAKLEGELFDAQV
jgi:hypothetical protein